MANNKENLLFVKFFASIKQYTVSAVKANTANSGEYLLENKKKPGEVDKIKADRTPVLLSNIREQIPYIENRAINRNNEQLNTATSGERPKT